MIILIGSQKGGCGKSTIAINIAVALSNLNKDVILVDADRQPTSSNFCLDREESEFKNINNVQKYENIKDTILDLNKRYEFVIVDVSGRDSRELRTGMLGADLMIIPFKPSQPDLDTLPNIVEIIEQAKDFNSNLKAKALLTMCPTHHMIKEKDEAKEYLNEFPQIELMQSFVCDRKIYRDSLSDGKGVVECDNAKAKEEIDNLIGEILNA